MTHVDMRIYVCGGGGGGCGRGVWPVCSLGLEIAGSKHCREYTQKKELQHVFENDIIHFLSL